MKDRIALIFGSTGLIGNLLLSELISSEKYSMIKIFVRQPSGFSNLKVKEMVVDFSNFESFSSQISGDDLFICIGSTIKKAGAVANMEKIDRDLPYKIASVASANGVARVAVVSSIGANPRSGNYYLRIKGEMEELISKLKFDHVAVVRPSMLTGERKERRTGEIAGKVLMSIFNPLLAGKLRKYRSIHAGDVARAMISAIQEDTSKVFYESDELQKLADKLL
jgi:uncharacterized protein YbjT (DUF2867 family)